MNKTIKLSITMACQKDILFFYICVNFRIYSLESTISWYTILLFCYNAQEQIKRMVYQHVDMSHIIDHGKNIGFLDLDHRHSTTDLVIC